MAADHLMWKSGERKKLFSCVLFDINSIERTHEDGRRGDFIELECNNWIVALPWFRRGDGVPCFIMEEQFRHGSESVTREFPAGLVEPSEEPLEAAKRELFEETGIKGRFTLIGNVNPNSAFMCNRQCFYLVEGLERTGTQSLDQNEQIDVIEVPVEEVIRDMGTGLYDNGIMMMALGFFMRLAQERPELRSVL